MSMPLDLVFLEAFGVDFFSMLIFYVCLKDNVHNFALSMFFRIANVQPLFYTLKCISKTSLRNKISNSIGG